MKKLTLTLIFVLGFFFFSGLSAQDVAAKLNEAEKEYSAKNLDNTRFALQGALVEINKAVGQQILELLPKTMMSLAFNPAEDNFGGAGSFAGLFVNRSYGSEPKNVKIDIMGDSPLLTSLNAILSMPAIMGSSDPNQKRIKVAGYKSLLQKDATSVNDVSYNLQIPMNQTLVTVHYSGITDENEIIKSAESLPLDKIAQLAK
jgi:hypothetical protein